MATPYRWQDNLVRRGWLKILSHSELAILYAYSTSVNVRNRQTWLSAERVAEFTGLAPSTVYDGLNKLRGHELLQTERREKPNNYQRTYFVDVHTLCDPDKIPAAPSRIFRKPGASVNGDIPKPQNVNGESNAVMVAPQEEAHSETVDRPQPPQNGMTPAPDLKNGDPIREVSTKTLSTKITSQIIREEKDKGYQGSAVNGESETALSKLARYLPAGVVPSLSVIQQLKRAGPREGWTDGDVDNFVTAAMGND